MRSGYAPGADDAPAILSRVRSGSNSPARIGLRRGQRTCPVEVSLERSVLDPNYYYSVKELAFLWNMSAESIRRLFEKEAGTLIFKIQTSGRRTYRNFRIPGEVALRVKNRMAVVPLEPRRLRRR